MSRFFRCPSCPGWLGSITLLALALSVTSSLAAEPPKVAEPGTIVVLDQNGKPHTLKKWKFLLGVRRLSWLASTTEKGPEAFELREDNSTNYKDGIVTFLPFENLRKIEYDDAKKTVTAKVATSTKEEEDVTLVGSTAFKDNTNKLSIECEVDKGELGIAEIRFVGGMAGGIRGILFPAPKPIALPNSPKQLQLTDSERKTTHKLVDLQPLYEMADGSIRVQPTLMFKKSLRVDLTKLQKIRSIGDKTKRENDFEVTLHDGECLVLTLLSLVPFEDKPANLLGLVGKSTSGYRLFGIPAIGEIVVDTAKKE